MNTSSRARPLSLQRSWTRRALDCGADALGRWLDRSRAVFVRWQQARRLRREHAALRELDAATLRDLGAPPWLQSEAQAHSDALSFERDVLRLHGGMAKGRFD